jgi:hypothetical protein
MYLGALKMAEVEEPAIIEWLLSRAKLAEEKLLTKPSIGLGQVKMWSGSIRSRLNKIYGGDHPLPLRWLPKEIADDVDPKTELARRIQLVKEIASGFEQMDKRSYHGPARVFIGHGQSPVWRELKDFLQDRLGLAWDEFNREAVAGVSTFERLSEMLDAADFAFMVMTAEDMHDDDTVHARQNVVHEVGLFQGRLGPRKAIILLEQGCSEFTNIVGLSQIRFPKNNVGAAFEEIRRVLEREKVGDT